MHSEEITDERRSNNNNNIYVQFAAVYTTVKGKTSSCILRLDDCSLFRTA